MRALFVAALMGATSASAASDAGQRLNFLACPQIHDTTPTCWTAQYQGETYYLGTQRGPGESYLPQMRHQVLVEGVVTDAPRVCGGLVMRPVRLSVMPELDLSCDSAVHSGDGLTPPTVVPRARLVSRPPSVESEIGSFMRAEPPEPPFAAREFRIEFDFGTDLLVDQMQRRVIEVLTHANAMDASRITITGFSATTLLSDGQLLAEPAGLAEQRARKVARILADLGAAKQAITVEWADSSEPADGIGDADRRRVIVALEP